MNEMRWFMYENGTWNDFLYMEKEICHWRPSWIKISKWGYVHQWAPIDNVNAWPCQGHIIEYRDLRMTMDRSILTKSKISYIWRPFWIRAIFYLTCIKVLSQVTTLPNMNETQWLMHWDLTSEWSILTNSKIGCMRAILDQTKILLDLHQGPITGHDHV